MSWSDKKGLKAFHFSIFVSALLFSGGFMETMFVQWERLHESIYVVRLGHNYQVPQK